MNELCNQIFLCGYAGVYDYSDDHYDVDRVDGHNDRLQEETAP